MANDKYAFRVYSIYDDEPDILYGGYTGRSGGRKGTKLGEEQNSYEMRTSSMHHGIKKPGSIYSYYGNLEKDDNGNSSYNQKHAGYSIIGKADPVYSIFNPTTSGHLMVPYAKQLFKNIYGTNIKDNDLSNKLIEFVSRPENKSYIDDLTDNYSWGDLDSIKRNLSYANSNNEFLSSVIDPESLYNARDRAIISDILLNYVDEDRSKSPKYERLFNYLYDMHKAINSKVFIDSEEGKKSYYNDNMVFPKNALKSVDNNGLIDRLVSALKDVYNFSGGHAKESISGRKVKPYIVSVPEDALMPAADVYDTLKKPGAKVSYSPQRDFPEELIALRLTPKEEIPDIWKAIDTYNDAKLRGAKSHDAFSDAFGIDADDVPSDEQMKYIYNDMKNEYNKKRTTGNVVKGICGGINKWR